MTAIPLDELVVGVRADKFYLRWPAARREIVVTGSHMLNSFRAPAVCRFLAELNRDGYCQLGGFTWGPVSSFPFLPRIRTGRIVLSLAQWRITAHTRETEFSCNRENFRESLERWRTKWRVPQHVFLTTADNRLLLDLNDDMQASELQRSIRKVSESGSVLLTEVRPYLDQAWVKGTDGSHFITELVVSLIFRSNRAESIVGDTKRRNEGAGVDTRSYVQAQDHRVAEVASRIRPPGSDWLFAKLYCGREFQDRVISGPLRNLGEWALNSETVDQWFFLRHADPDAHIRLRFHGDSKRLVQKLFPALCDWANDLTQSELCSHFVIDTYEREIERYGGPTAMAVAEALFAADTDAVVQILNLLEMKKLTLDLVSIAVLSLDDLLASLQLSDAECRNLSQMYSGHRNESGVEYRKRKALLLSLLGNADRWERQPGGPDLADVFARRRGQLIRIARRFSELQSSGELSRSLPTLCQSFMHLHLNRLLAGDGPTERRILGLLWRTRQALASRERTTSSLA